MGVKNFYICIFGMLFLLLYPSVAANAEQKQDFATSTLEDNLQAISKVVCGFMIDDELVPVSSGSGVVMSSDWVITNAHVVYGFDEQGDPYQYDFCLGGVAPNAYTPPGAQFILAYTEVAKLDQEHDYAFMEPIAIENSNFEFTHFPTYGNPDSLTHGNELTLIGFPTVASSTITSTKGTVSGFIGTSWIKSDAIAEFGNSGGGAFDTNGNLVGIPTRVSTGELNSFTVIQNLNSVLEDALGEEIVVRDYDNLYTIQNETCFPEFGECFQFGEGEDSTQIIPEDGSKLKGGTGPTAGSYDPSKHDPALVERLKGKILLQVDDNGEAWYLNPVDLQRYYLKDGAAAYEAMRSFGLGISDADLATIPAVENVSEMLGSTSACNSNPLARQLAGRILLQVQQRGEAWYIDPDKCRRVYMKDGEAAYSIMRFLSLGISNENLSKIPVGTLSLSRINVGRNILAAWFKPIVPIDEIDVLQSATVDK